MEANEMFISNQYGTMFGEIGAQGMQSAFVDWYLALFDMTWPNIPDSGSWKVYFML